MSNPDSQALRYCARCKSSGDDVCWSEELEMYTCDECYRELIEDVEDES